MQLVDDEGQNRGVIPIEEALRMEAHRGIVFKPGPAGRRSFYAMPYENFYIWGATAGMLRNLFHFLRA